MAQGIVTTMLFAPKTLDMEIGIMSFDGDHNHINTTSGSIKNLSYNYEYFVLMPSVAKMTHFEHRTYKCKDTVTSLLNEGMKNATKEWVYFVYASCRLRMKIDEKLSKFITSNKDILFPVVDRIWNFVDGSINGILINKEFFDEVGPFGEENDLKITKLEWADRAIKKGGKFKAIVNAMNL